MKKEQERAAEIESVIWKTLERYPDLAGTLSAMILDVLRGCGYEVVRTNETANYYILSNLGISQSVLPMVITDAPNDPIEVIWCDSISGGKDYIENMPAELGLVRTLKGKEFRGRYILSNRKVDARDDENKVLHPDMFGGEDYPSFTAPVESSDIFAKADERDLAKGAEESLRKIKPEVSKLANYLKIYQMLLRDFRPAVINGAFKNAALFISSAISWNFPHDEQLAKHLRLIENCVESGDIATGEAFYKSALERLEHLMHVSGEFWGLDFTKKETAPESAVHLKGCDCPSVWCEHTDLP